MPMDLNWFQLGPIPSNAMQGEYNLKLVFLSYVIAFLASYVALDLVGRLRAEKNQVVRRYWLCGGAFAMGAGIWSMHFIGMLAFIMPMSMGYSLTWTASSFVTVIAASGLALYILQQKNRKTIHLVLGGILIGLGIATMHYMGMEGMTSYVQIRFLPGLFLLSLAIGIFAAEVALWLALQSNQGSSKRQFYLKIISALIMGVAICGMHYTGMAAAVFTPLPNAQMSSETIPPVLLALFIAGLSSLIIILALTVSTYYKNLGTAIQNEKDFLNVMLNNIEDGIIACDADGRITVFNDSLQKGFKIPILSQSKIEWGDFFTLYPLGSNMALSKNELPLFRALKGETIHAKEFLLRFKNGLTRNVVVDGQPIITSYGEKIGAVMVIHDITEIKQTEKMKTEFVSVVSHELRTPLTSILGSLGLLLGGLSGTLPAKAIQLLEIANKNCERLLLLINDILDMEKIQAGKMLFDLKVVNLNQLVKEAIRINKMYAEKYHVKMKLLEPPQEISVFVDPDRLLQVLANLISNAAKFSPTGGLVTLKITQEEAQVRVSVIDKGPGIPLKFQSRIFQKFSQADSSDTRGKGGTGLGLNISKALVEKLGGTIGFISQPNEGSIFYFKLPIYQVIEKL